ncbi:MAG: hypothetical protein D6813_06965 [Calditrichaeota bacterium]|nr:MAG: hypothetical protein D6813_06965 [Calditrichota bacterium]
MRWLYLICVSVFFITCRYPHTSNVQVDQDATTVFVENQNYLDMTVYLLFGSHRVRLGTVTGLSSRLFVIPEHVLHGAQSVRLLADPVGGRISPVTQEIFLVPGDKVEMVIPNN